MEPSFHITRADGTTRDLKLTNARERVSIHSGIEKTYHNHCRLHSKGFNPGPREQQTQLAELERCLQNILVIRSHLEYHGQIPLAILIEATNQYQQWLGLTGPDGEDDDRDATSFFDANHSLGAGVTQTSSRPNTPAPAAAQHEVPEHVRNSPEEQPPSQRESPVHIGPPAGAQTKKPIKHLIQGLGQNIKNQGNHLAALLTRNRSTQSEPSESIVAVSRPGSVQNAALPDRETIFSPRTEHFESILQRNTQLFHEHKQIAGERFGAFRPVATLNPENDQRETPSGESLQEETQRLAETVSRPPEEPSNATLGNGVHQGQARVSTEFLCPPPDVMPTAKTAGWNPPPPQEKTNLGQNLPGRQPQPWVGDTEDGQLVDAVSRLIAEQLKKCPPPMQNLNGIHQTTERWPQRQPEDERRIPVAWSPERTRQRSPKPLWGSESEAMNTQTRTPTQYVPPAMSGVGISPHLSELVASLVDNHIKRAQAIGGPHRITPPGPPLTNGTSIANMTVEGLTTLIRSAVDAQQTRQGYLEPQYDYTPRGRFHLMDLDKFAGDVEHYPVFRQNLLLCLERERFRDTKDKAVFIYKYLSGPAKEMVTHLMRPLANETWETILKKLDRAYGRENEVDRILIRKLYKLPKLNELTQENLLHMATVLEAAIPALLRREPESVTAIDCDKINRLVNLLPPVDRDLFYSHCKMTNQFPNVKGLLHYLDEKFDMRKHTLPIKPERTQQKPQTKASRIKPLYLTTPRDEWSNPSGGSSSESVFEDDTPGTVLKTDESQNTQTEKKYGPCKHCAGPHTLGYCNTFKDLPLAKRREVVDAAKACSSCLATGHFARTCRRRRNCPHPGCDMRHHHLLHDDYIVKLKFFEETGSGYADLKQFTEPPSPNNTDI